MIPVYGSDQVVALSIFGEIFFCVINDMSCPKLAYKVQVPRAAHGCNFSDEHFSKLHRKFTNATRRAINENLLPALNVPFVAQGLYSGQCRDSYGCLLLERN